MPVRAPSRWLAGILGPLLAAGAVHAQSSKIAWVAHRDTAVWGNVYVMDAMDGSNPANLSTDPSGNYLRRPAWSPDGTLIAYSIYHRVGCDFEILVIDAADGGNRTSLFAAWDHVCVADPSPSWSPDGSRIAFSFHHDGDGNSEIYVVNADGSEAMNLTNHAATDGSPSWSPDGSWIAFVSNRDGNVEIYVMDALDGSGQTRLTFDSAADTEPAWSPDGARIAFTSGRDGNDEVYSMNALDGSDLINLSESPGADGDPSWSPDGMEIAFTSDRDGDTEIYVMDALDGSGQTNLSMDLARDEEPSWSPLLVPEPSQRPTFAAALLLLAWLRSRAEPRTRRRATGAVLG